MKVKNLRSLLESGKIFNVTFTKKSGELRQMNARLGVKKHLKGVGLNYNPDDKNLLVCFDLTKNAYRTINASTVKSITCNGTTFKIEE